MSSLRPKTPSTLGAILRAAVRWSAGLAFGAAFLFGAASLAVQTAEAVPSPRRLAFVPNAWDERFFMPVFGATQFHPDWIWQLRPGVQVLETQVNSLGFLGPAVGRTRGPAARIAVLGDGFTVGLGMHDESTWPRKLETRLRADGRAVDVLNFAVPAFTAVQGLEFFRGRVREWSPDVVVAAFGAYYESHPAHRGIGDRRLLESTRSPGQRAKHLLERNGSLRWLLHWLSPPDRVLDPRRGEDGSFLPRVTPTEMEETLVDLVREVRAAGAQPVLVVPPRMPIVDRRWHPGLLRYDDATRSAGLGSGAQVIDVRAGFEEGQPGGAAVAVRSAYFADANRLSESGCTRYAEIVAGAIDAAGLLPSKRPTGDGR